MGRAARRKAAKRAERARPDVAEAVARLKAYEQVLDWAYPGWAGHMDRFRTGLRDEVGWPEWCLVPMAAAYAVVSGGGDNTVPFRELGMVAMMSALYAWRMGRDIWRASPELAEAVLATDMDAPIPVEVLYHLPGWCVYLLDPGCPGWPEGVVGAWCHLEWDANSGRAELRVVLDLGGDPKQVPSSTICVPLHLEAGRTVQDMLASADRVAEEGARRGGRWLPKGSLTGAASIIQPVVALLLYICSRGADIRDPDHPGAQLPSRSVTPRPAGPPRVWEMGYRIATALRASRLAPHGGSGAPTGRSVAAHLRRAHWHLYWTGPGSRSDPAKRVAVVRWVHPVLVGAGEVMPAVREVRKP